MAETLGQRLARARKEKGLTLEDVARATKIRVPRLRDMEADDYSNFPSLVYARGFLKNYTAFLGIDASETIERLETVTDLDAEGYQYLSQDTVTGERARRKPPSKLPKLVFGLVMMVAVMFLVGGWLYLTSSLKRLYPGGDGESSVIVGVDEVDSGAQDGEAAQPTTEPTPEQVRRILDAGGVGGGPSVEESDASIGSGAALMDEEAKPVMRAIPVGGQPVDPEVGQPTYEVTIQPVERSWVKIIRDNPDAPPVFEDYLDPGEPPLVFTGSKFWITVMERDAIIVRRNGVPVVFEGTALVID